MELQDVIRPYSPWHDPATLDAWSKTVPTFRRPVFEELFKDMCEIPQIVSLAGPRRVGKSTLLKQMVQELLATGTPPHRIVYYAMDDPLRYRCDKEGMNIVENLMAHMATIGKEGPTYVFLDEIQTLERWEQYLKKYYDLEYPVKMIVSGSASSPIFKKSRESLLGRVKDHHILPFSFSEFLRFKIQGNQELTAELDNFRNAGTQVRGMLTEHPDYLTTGTVNIPRISDSMWEVGNHILKTYLLEGGFPEVWSLPTAEQKLEYLYDNQIKKVIYEDLVLAAEFRKPEQLKAFYVSLLEKPGREVNLTVLARETGINVQQVEKYFPLLELTDLLAHTSRFRNTPVRARKGNRKFYLVDLALRNAVLRIGPSLHDDSTMLGLYAENLVFNALRSWKGLLQIDYYHNGKKEVDFIAHLRGSKFFGVEVKYKNSIDDRELLGLKEFADSHATSRSMVVIKNREPVGRQSNGFFYLPLLAFLMLWH